MASEPLIPNALKEERIAAGMETPAELAARADIDPVWYRNLEEGRVLPTAAELERLTTALGGISARQLYGPSVTNAIPNQKCKDAATQLAGYSPSSYFRTLADQCHMLVARDEITWFERQPGPDHRVEVYVNMSCGTQMVPHLLLDTVAVLEKLGVSFVAAAGAAACCGKPFINTGQAETAERHSQGRINRSLQWGARTQVNWCQNCQATSTYASARRFHADGVEHPIREVQIPTFLEERVRELGDNVPWEKEVPRRVLVEGHPVFSPIHRDAWMGGARLLDLIPGVEVVDLYDGHSEESPCTAGGRDPDWTPSAWYQRQNTVDGVREHRARLAEHVRSRGADTVSCRSQNCHRKWSRYASDALAVRHVVSILAEALGCAHPDRYQAAVRLGDPAEFVAQTRPVWQSWGFSEAKARELAAEISDPTFADPVGGGCSCRSGHGCQEKLAGVDVLTGASRPG